MTKFNPKQYQDKNRVYVKVPRANLITRLYSWDAEKKEYRAPQSGKPYFARRYEIDSNGKRVLKGQYFEELDEARLWQQQPQVAQPLQPTIQEPEPAPEIPEEIPAPQPEKRPISPTLGEIYQEWKLRRFSALGAGTQRNYERYVRLHFQPLWHVPVCEITPRVVDEWLDGRKAALPQSLKANQRTAFKHELSVLRVLLKYFAEYYDDVSFRMPLKERHVEAARVRRRSDEKPKDLTEDEFWRFHAALLPQKYGRVYAAMATVQYFQALRVCEVAALRWEDVLLDHRDPRCYRLRISQHVEYPRVGGMKPVVVPGLKNDKGNPSDKTKELPVFPETFKALREFCAFGGRGLVFTSGLGQLFTYRQIQKAYDTAFINAKLSYRGTHVLRHGGTRRIYNETCDLAVAQQLLGNSDLDSTLVYAKRQKDALTRVASGHWDRRKVGT
jgi:integrase